MIDTQREAATIWALDFDAELPCESSHSHPANKICSGLAVAHQTSCRKNQVVCQNHEAYIKDCIGDIRRLCVGCENPCAECWSIRPI